MLNIVLKSRSLEDEEDGTVEGDAAEGGGK